MSSAPGTNPEDRSAFSSRIGVVGLGLIGSAISRRLLLSGKCFVGWDINSEQRDQAVALGVLSAGAPQELVDCVEVLVLCLPHDGVSREFLSSVKLRSGQIIFDTSTGAPRAAMETHEHYLAQDILYLDTPLSGSSVQLSEGKAVFMVGAPRDAWPRAREFLTLIAPEVYHVGSPGAGAKMKLVTNLVLGLNRAALAEGLSFASQQGLDLEMTLSMLRATPAHSRIMDTKGEKMIHSDFAPQARLSQHLKDVRLMLAAAGDELALPLTETHRRILEHVEAQGFGDLDNSALIKFYQK